MPVKDVFKISRKTFFNPSGWLDYNSISAQFRTTWTIIKGLFNPQTPEVEETFEQALVRLKLTLEDIQNRAKQYQAYTLLFLILGGCSFSYSFYLLFFHKTFTGWLLGMGMTALFLVQAFRFDFWRFQIKHKKLGCSIDEWWSGKIKDTSEEKNP